MNPLAFLTLLAAISLLLAPPTVAEGTNTPLRGDCPLCKAPNRAALLAGLVKPCPADCNELCCTGTPATFLVEGLVCVNCSSAVTAALAKLDGVRVTAVCHNTGQALVKYDADRITPQQLVATIVAAGHPVTGEKLTFAAPGMTDEHTAAALEAALVRIEGVKKIVTTIGPHPRVDLVVTPGKGDRDAIRAVIDAAGATETPNAG